MLKPDFVGRLLSRSRPFGLLKQIDLLPAGRGRSSRCPSHLNSKSLKLATNPWPSDPAFGGLELDPPVERVAGVVLAGPDDHFAGSLTGRDDPSPQGSVLVLQTVLDIIGPQAGQAIVDGRNACRAGVADDLEASLVGRRTLRDLAEPGVVGSPDFAVGIELG